MNRKVLVGTALLLSVAVLVWANVRKLDGSPTAARDGNQQGPAGAPLVKVEEVKKRAMSQEVMAPGSVEAGALRELRAPFASKQVRLLVGLGEEVKEGQVLAELAAEELAAQVTAQEAQVARAESALANLRLQQQQAPLQLAQRLEQARSQLLQAQDGLASADRQSATLRTRLEQTRANLDISQRRGSEGSAQVDSARLALVKAEDGYRADPLNPALREAYEQARSAYDAALQQSQSAAQQAASDLRKAYDDLEAAEVEYARGGGENPVAVQMARSQLESARLAVRLAEMEAASGGNLAQQARAAETDLAAAQSSLQNLRERLASAQVKAPVGGTVLAVGVKDMLPVQDGQVLFSLGGMSAMKVTARVDEVDIGKVKPGQALSVRSTAYPTERFQGKVLRAAAQASAPPQGGSSYYVVEGQVSNPGGLLRSGMNAEVTIATEKRESTIVVGLAAVREQGQTASVLVVEDFKVRERPVKLGLRTQTEVEILDGLEEGDLVVVSPFTLINSLKDGTPVRTGKVTDSGGKVE